MFTAPGTYSKYTSNLLEVPVSTRWKNVKKCKCEMYQRLNPTGHSMEVPACCRCAFLVRTYSVAPCCLAGPFHLDPN